MFTTIASGPVESDCHSMPQLLGWSPCLADFKALLGRIFCKVTVMSRWSPCASPRLSQQPVGE